MLELALRREIIINRTACRLIGVFVFIVLTALGAFVRIPLPFTPVPITLQTFFVLLCGAFLGGRLGATSQLSYVALGALGLPIFTNAGGGLLYLYGPTAGYLFGFVIAAFIAGSLLRFGRANFFLAFLFLYLADLVLLASGAFWLRITTGLSFSQILLIGFLPFACVDLFKALAAALLYSKFRSRVKEIF